MRDTDRTSARPGRAQALSGAAATADRRSAPRNPHSFDPGQVLPDPDALRLVPRELAVRYLLVPLGQDGSKIRLAMADPGNLEALDTVRMATGLQPSAVAATEEQVGELIRRFYGAGAGSGELDAVVAEVARFDRDRTDGTELPIVRLADQLLAQAVQMRATDLHIQPEESDLAVRLRIDGRLQTVHRLPIDVHPPLLTRIKVLASLDISERRLPQDGKIELALGERRIDLRVSTFPTIHGENLVMRILDHSQLSLGFAELGFRDEDQQRLERLVARPSGILLIVGPTGSGKTTTLYAALKRVDRERLNIMTLEDPVEYRLPGIRQAQVHEKAGFTFAAGLRALLRQDPDVLLVGEIRDRETAEIAGRAALTGHLVLSTLHTRSALGAIMRLRDMGVEDYLVASTLIGVVSQRLVRRICRACSQPRPPQEAERAILGLDAGSMVMLHSGAGCPECGGSGYRGRFALHEIVEVDEGLAARIGAGRGESEMLEYAGSTGFQTLQELGRARVLEGWTTLEELARVAA